MTERLHFSSMFSTSQTLLFFKLIAALLLIAFGCLPASSFVLPPDATESQHEMTKESSQIETRFGHFQPSQEEYSPIKTSLTESGWLRDFQNSEQQNSEVSKQPQGSKPALNPPNTDGVKKPTSKSAKSNVEKPSRKGIKNNDSSAGKSGTLRNLDRLSTHKEATKPLIPREGYMTLEERIAAWLLAKRKEEGSWPGHSDEDLTAEPEHNRLHLDDPSVLLHLDKTDGYGGSNSRNSFPYEEHQQPPVHGYNSHGDYDDSLHAYHFNNGFMSNGIFPSFDGADGLRNFMDIGKTKRGQSFGKDRASSTGGLFDKPESRRGNKDAVKPHFMYDYDAESHFIPSDVKSSYPFFDKEYGMEDFFPFEGVIEKEKRSQYPKNTKKNQPKNKETNSFYTLENYIEEPVTDKEVKNVKASVLQNNTYKTTTTKKPNAKKTSNSVNNNSNSKKNKGKVDSKVSSLPGNNSSNRVSNAVKRNVMNESRQEANIISFASNSSLNESVQANVSASSRVSAGVKGDKHLKLEELSSKDGSNVSTSDRNQTTDVVNETSGSNVVTVERLHVASPVVTDRTSSDETPLDQITGSKVGNESNGSGQTILGQSQQGVTAYSMNSTHLNVEQDTKLLQSKQEAVLSIQNSTLLNSQTVINSSQLDESIQSIQEYTSNLTLNANNLNTSSPKTEDVLIAQAASKQAPPGIASDNAHAAMNNISSQANSSLQPAPDADENRTPSTTEQTSSATTTATASNASIKEILNPTVSGTSTDKPDTNGFSHRNESILAPSETMGSIERFAASSENSTKLAFDLAELKSLEHSAKDSNVNGSAMSHGLSAAQSEGETVAPGKTEENNSTASVQLSPMANDPVSVSYKNVEQNFRNHEMSYEKLFASSANNTGVLVDSGSELVNTSEHNSSGVNLVIESTGNSSHLASMFEKKEVDMKSEEMAPKGTDREEKSIANEDSQNHAIKHHNKTEPESLRSSEVVPSRVEILNVTVDSVDSVNASFVNVSTTVKVLLPVNESSLPTANTTSVAVMVTTVSNGSALVSQAASRSNEQRQQNLETPQVPIVSHSFNISQPNVTAKTDDAITFQPAENASVFLIGENEAVQFKNITSEVDSVQTTVISHKNETNTNNLDINRDNTTEPAISPQEKNLTSRFTTDSNVSRKLFSLQYDSNNVTEHISTQVSDMNESQAAYDNHTTGIATNGSLSLSSIHLGNTVDNTHHFESNTTVANITSAHTTQTPTLSHLPTTSSTVSIIITTSTTSSTTSGVMSLPEALPNSQDQSAKQTDDYKPQLEKIVDAPQSVSGSVNESMSFNSILLKSDAGQVNTSTGEGEEDSAQRSASQVSSMNNTLFPDNNETVAAKFIGGRSGNDSANHQPSGIFTKSDHSLNISIAVGVGNEGISSAAASLGKDDLTSSTSGDSSLKEKRNDVSRNVTTISGGVRESDVNATSFPRQSMGADHSGVTKGDGHKTTADVNGAKIIQESAVLNANQATTRLSNANESEATVVSERDIPPISAYMIQDFSLRKPTTDTKTNKDDGNKSGSKTKSGSAQSSDGAKADKNQGVTNASSAASNDSSSSSSGNIARDAPCLGPECELSQMSAVSRSQAAVSAVLTSHFGPAKDIMIPFDLELLDLSDNYDNSTGMFICTVPGTYVISLYLMSHPGAKVNARIFVNNRPIAALWADDSKNAGFYPSSSTQTIAQLGFGDQVYVMLVDGGYGESWVHANYNVFTIFLLYEQMF
ncbi:hypothetical protein Btru_009943 [Bulinus truncatus]|nr:hypothetical protein Btru_009943 [Bulinus truncatus]